LLLFKVIVFSVLVYILYSRLNKLDWSQNQLHHFKLLPFIVCFLFVPLNWYFEWIKWELLVKSINEERNPNKLTAFASGVVSSFLTPAFSGNFLGRIVYFESNKRWKLTVYSLVSNFSQFAVSMVFGAIAGVFLLQNDSTYFGENSSWILILTAVGSLMIYFFGETFAAPIKIQRIQSMVLLVKKGPSRIKIIGVSLLRYLVFVLQFSLALSAFGVHFEWIHILWIALVYMAVTLTPSLLFGKIVMRESIAVSILSLAGIAAFPVLLASLTTWLFNLLIPTFIAIFFVKFRRV
jgi:hypothetical protein